MGPTRSWYESDWVRPPFRVVHFGAVVVVLAFILWSWGLLPDEERTLHELILDCDIEAVAAKITEAGTSESGNDLVSATDCGAAMVREMLDSGANPNAMDSETGEAALHRAASLGNGDTIEVLLDAGADPDSWTDAGETALLIASSSGEAEVVGALLAGGADLNLPTDRGHTPVFRAVAYGQAAILEQLLDSGALPEAEAEVIFWDIAFVGMVRSGDLTFDDPDETIVALGPSLGLDDSIVEAAAGEGLEESWLDFDMNETVGVFTPLYIAAVFGDDAMVRLLLDAGADPTIGTQPTGHLPGEAAEALGHSEVAELLTVQ